MSRHTRRLAITPPAYARGLDSAIDTFTDTDGVLITEHKTDLGGIWISHKDSPSFAGAVIDSNRCRQLVISGISTTRILSHSSIPKHADYEVACDIRRRTDDNTSQVGVLARMNPSLLQYYWANYHSLGDTWRLHFQGSPSYFNTDLAPAVPQVLVADQVYRLTLSVRGSLIRVLVDGVEIMSVVHEDPIITAGRAGMRLSGAATLTTGVHLDNWQATALAD